MREFDVYGVKELSSLTDVSQSAIMHKGEVYSYFDSGFTRHVFVNADKTKVVKILRGCNVFDFNKQEHEIYLNANEDARSRMAQTALDPGTGIIEQEFANPIKFDERPLTIKQHSFSLKCRGEVGWTNDGRLVCFDLNEYMSW